MYSCEAKSSIVAIVVDGKKSGCCIRSSMWEEAAAEEEVGGVSGGETLLRLPLKLSSKELLNLGEDCLRWSKEGSGGETTTSPV